MLLKNNQNAVDCMSKQQELMLTLIDLLNWEKIKNYDFQKFVMFDQAHFFLAFMHFLLKNKA